MNRKFLFLRAPLFYFLFGVVWILTSDAIMSFYLTPVHWVHAGATKGLVFVTISSVLIFLLLVYEWRQREAATASLALSETRFSTYFQLSPLPTLLVSLPDARFLEANQAFYVLTGISRAQLIGKTLPEVDSFMEQEERARLWEILEHKGTIENFPTTLRAANGETRDILLAADVIELEDTCCLLAILNDITERHKTEEKLRSNENMLQTLFAAIPVMLVFIDRGGRWYMFNHEWIRVTGWTAAELEGGDAASLLTFNEEQAHSLRHHLQGEARHWRQFETRTRSGSRIATSWSKVDLDDGTTIAIVQDISERRQAEQQLRESEERFRAMVQFSPDMIALVNTDGIYVYVSPSVKRCLGYEAHELLGHSVFHLIHPDDEPQAKDRFRRLLDPARSIAQGFQVEELRFCAPDGSWRWLEVTATNMLDQPGLHAVVVNLRDVTERKRIGAELQRAYDEMEMRVERRTRELADSNRALHGQMVERQMAMGALKDAVVALQKAKEEAERARQDAERANQAKSEFLSRMSHELRTPMNAILGFGQLLQMRQLDIKENENVEQILKAGRHLLQLINEVLEIARIDAGHVPLSIEPVAIYPMMHEVLDLVRPLAAETHIELIEAPATSPDDNAFIVLADRQRIQQVLLNLLSNAIKYNRPQGWVKVSCHTVAATTDGKTDQIRIEVQDTGLGVRPEDREKLFVAFERLGAERTRIEGTGIGLALVKQLVEMMHGMIGVESTPSEGSTFWVQLPGAPSGAQSITPSTVELPSLALLHIDHPATMLYIEDNVSNLKMVEALMDNIPNLRLLTAIQGGIGVELARQHLPDLILLDLHLPDISGEEVLRRLRADATTHDIPVVILSADASDGHIKKLLASGTRNYLTKPLEIKHFLDILQEVLKEREGRR